MKWLNKNLPGNNFFSKINLIVAKKSIIARIFNKIVESIIVPVLIGILAGWGNRITSIVALIWWSVGIYGIFTNWEDFITIIILRFFGIVE